MRVLLYLTQDQQYFEFVFRTVHPGKLKENPLMLAIRDLAVSETPMPNVGRLAM
jgi:hypothetical protein